MRRNFYVLIVALATICSSAFAQKNVLYITGEGNGAFDQVVIDAITAYDGGSAFNVTIDTSGDVELTADKLPAFNAADVVIMGRSINSGTIANVSAIWDQITSPVLYTSVYCVRDTKSGMFNIGNCNSYDVDDAAVIQGEIQDIMDPIFDGINDMNIEWWIGDYSALDPVDAGNGTMLIKTTDGIPLLARFDANVAFYEGSMGTPAGPRTYMGMGQDKTDANYFNYSDIGKTIFFNELTRMANLGGTSALEGVSMGADKVIAVGSIGSIEVEAGVSADVYSVDGKVVASGVSNGTIPCSAGIYIVKVGASVEKVVVK